MLLQLLGPRTGEKWCKASSLLFLQWPGWLFEVGVWVEKTVKVLTQLLQEAANADLVKHLSRV